MNTKKRKNTGKIFEDDYKKSVECDDSLINIRLRDEAQSFMKSAKFSHKNICDFILFDTEFGVMSFLELKSTKEKYMGFEDITLDDDDIQERMIHKHQILGLSKYARKRNVISGFILNFRNEKDGTQRTFYIGIEDFLKMIARIGKKSFNMNDLIDYNGIEIDGERKRTRYRWNIKSLLTSIVKNKQTQINE